MDGHPVQLVVEDDLERSRLTVFFRLLLAIPHFIWLVLWSVAAFFTAFAGWLVALFTGRLPDGLHAFLGRYLRYVTHLGAYLSIAANPYPGFVGDPDYPVDLVLPENAPQARWKTGLRIVLALPALVLAAVLGSDASWGGGGRYSGSASDRAGGSEWIDAAGLGGVAALCAIFGWFAVLAIGRMPTGLRNLAAYSLGYTAQAYAYLLLLTDRYPNSDPEAIGPAWQLPEHPVRLELADDRRRSRLTVFFRLLLAIPHLVWILLWSLAAVLAAVANGVVALVRGRSAETLHRFLTAYVRYSAHVTAFVSLVANPFPGFVGAPGYPVDVALGPPERQNRWITFFRVILAIPAFLLSGALSLVLVVVGLLGWFASLATGRMPTGLRNLGAFCVRYLAQTNAYSFVVTDAYPNASPALRPPPEPEPAHRHPNDPAPEAV